VGWHPISRNAKRGVGGNQKSGGRAKRWPCRTHSRVGVDQGGVASCGGTGIRVRGSRGDNSEEQDLETRGGKNDGDIAEGDPHARPKSER